MVAAGEVKWLVCEEVVRWRLRWWESAFSCVLPSVVAEAATPRPWKMLTMLGLGGGREGREGGREGREGEGEREQRKLLEEVHIRIRYI